MADATSRRLVMVLVVLALVVGVGVGAVALFASDDEGDPDGGEVLLEAVASVGPAPFTPPLQSDDALTSSTSTSTSAMSTSATAGGSDGQRTAKGPFGGTGDDTLCDRELLVDFLTDPENGALAREWARVIDISVADIPTYVRTLTPTTLTADARVTNHRWNGTRAVPYQAVLQRGTAVLVDPYGRLVARCRCGNPLGPPVQLADPVYTGPRWDGFDPTVVVVVVASPTTIYPSSPVVPSPTTSVSLPPGADEAIRRIREPFEACARAIVGPSDGILTEGDIEALLPRIEYTATVVDEPARIYRVHIVIPSSDVASGSFVDGSTATWEVDLRNGTITPVDDGAREAAACPGMG